MKIILSSEWIPFLRSHIHIILLSSFLFTLLFVSPLNALACRSSALHTYLFWDTLPEATRQAEFQGKVRITDIRGNGVRREAVGIILESISHPNYVNASFSINYRKSTCGPKDIFKGGTGVVIGDITFDTDKSAVSIIPYFLRKGTGEILTHKGSVKLQKYTTKERLSRQKM